MKLDPSKLARQKQIARTFWQQGGIGSFLAATGFGKSFTAILIIKSLQRKFPGLTTLVVVPSDYLRDQWRGLIKSFGLSRIRVDTVHSMVKESGRVDFVILDEMHSYTSPVFSNIFDVINYTYLLGMTATMREDPERNRLLHEKCPVFDEVTLKECLEKGWVSPFVIYNYGLNLNEEDRWYYDNLSGKFNRAFAVFGHDLKLAFKCLEKKKVREAYAKKIKWDPGRVAGAAANMSKNMSERKEFLYNHPLLLDAGVGIVNYLGDDRKIITFGQSTDFADRMTQALGPGRSMSYHSKMGATEIDGKVYRGKKLKNKVIELFETNEIRVINTAESLDQGTDIEDIDTSLVCSGTSSVLQALQRTGRDIRVKEGKLACEINLFLRNTQSEKWLRKRQRKHPRKTIKYISDINEIAL